MLDHSDLCQCIYPTNYFVNFGSPQHVFLAISRGDGERKVLNHLFTLPPLQYTNKHMLMAQQGTYIIQRSLDAKRIFYIFVNHLEVASARHLSSKPISDWCYQLSRGARRATSAD